MTTNPPMRPCARCGKPFTPKRYHLVVVRQEAFESLDPTNRAEIDEHARRLGVVVLTAEAAAGDIRAEVFGERAEDAAEE